MATNIKNVYNLAQLVRYLYAKTSELAEDMSTSSLEYGMWTGLVTSPKAISFLPGTPSIDTIDFHSLMVDSISSIYSDLGLNASNFNNAIIDPDVHSLVDSKDKGLSPGDILEVKAFGSSHLDKDSVTYITMVMDAGNNQLITYPKIHLGSSKKNIKYTKLYSLKKTLPEGALNKLNTEVGQFLEYVSSSKLNAEIRPSAVSSTKGFLQIGDIKFIVSPTQISFSTQNGYQYFPTIRTRGNPKIPTMQEAKEVNISLIFPNTNSINNELLPLYAMFKRAPFVNIKNKDISNFFHELKDDEDFVSVALSSINIQSVKGFPNTVQASLTLLPFQKEAVGVAFKALKTFDDVRYKQLKYSYITDDFDSIANQSEARLRDKSAYFGNDISRIGLGKDNDIGFNITSDFSYSEPFRAYYQGLLKYRNSVTDELGNIIRKTNNDTISLNPFRPMKDTSYITAYIADANQRPFKLEYSYVDENVRDYTKAMNKRKMDARLDLSRIVGTARTALQSVDEFKENLQTTIITQQDFFDSTLAQFNSLDSFLSEYFQGLGLQINNPGVPQVKSLTELCIKIVKAKVNIQGISIEDAESLYNIGSKLLKKDEVLTINRQDNIEFTDKISITDKDGQTITADSYLDAIIEKMFAAAEILKTHTDEGESDTDYDKFVLFWQNIYDVISSGGDEIDLNTLLTKNIQGMSTDVVDIDNKNDVVDGWGITFSNKFVPMQLLGFKYPFYQHIGSDDINLSMSITSLQNGREYGLKEKLSLLNDRLQRTTKIILMNMPELIHAYDKNLKVQSEHSSATNPVPLADGHILSVFGLRNLVYNNSNVQTITGKPDAWSISVNFTQDNFTLQEYQSINSVDNNYTFEDDITNLLVRSDMNENKQVTVYDYIPNKEAIKAELIKAQTNEELAKTLQKMLPGIDLSNTAIQDVADNDLISSIGPLSSNMAPSDKSQLNDIIIGLNFAEYYKTFLMNIAKTLNSDTENFNTANRASSKTLIDNIIKEYKSNDVMSKLFLRVENKSDSSKLREALAGDNNERFKTIYKNVIARIDSLYELQANILFQGVPEPTLLRNLPITKWKDVITYGVQGGTVGLVMGGGYVLMGAAAGLTLVTGGLALPIAAVMIGFAAANVAAKVYNTAEAATSNALVSGLNAINSTIKNNKQTITKLLEGIRGSYLSQLSRIILKDPYILKQLFGDEVYEAVRDNYNSFGVNCYKDFDVKNVDIAVLNDDPKLSKQTFNFAPDFYLYNKDLGELKKEEFIKDELQNKITSSEIQANIIFQDFKKVVIKLETNKELLFKDDTELYGKIISDLKFMKNSNGTDANVATPNLSTTSDVDGIIVDLANVYLQIVSKYSGTGIVDNGNDTTATDALDVDGLKFNMLHVARITRLLSLREIQISINAAINDEQYSSYKTSKDKDKDQDKSILTLQGVSKTSVNKYKRYIDLYFSQFKSANEILLDQGQVESTEKQSLLYIPDGKRGSITQIETQIYTLLHQLYVLDSGIKDAVANGKMNINLNNFTDIPELELLKWYNWRSAEQALTDVEMLNDFRKFSKSQLTKSTAKLFPTQKIYFVEEDGKLVRNLDDYYSYDAIQAVDIVMNKYAAGRTAVLRLGNMFNNLTDKISIMAEALDFKDRIDQIDDLFLGTLDIKPGTKMIIKQGYSANDKDLPVVFVGKITDMKPGPVTEIVAQSYGAQLNHYIEKLNFGFLSSRNEHGDVAINILDKMISADGLGKMDPTNVLSTTFSGKNIGKVRENTFSKFLISNITTKLNAGLLAFDNPRDENIYLPLRLVDSVWDKITFDWRVYQQTVWQALGELALHHRNTFPMVKLYNNDRLASMDELRETVIVGDKAGYYKHTDSYGFSSMHYKQIKEAIDNWNTDMVPYLTLLVTGLSKHIIANNTGNITKDLIADGFARFAKENPIYGDHKVANLIGYIVKHTAETKKLTQHITNKYMSLLLIKKYMLVVEGEKFDSVTAFIQGIVGETFKDLFHSPDAITGLNKLLTIYTSKSSAFKSDLIVSKTSYKLQSALKYTYGDDLFINFLHSIMLMAMKKDGKMSFDLDFITEELSIEDYLDIKPVLTDNTEQNLARDMQYTKIQNHHLVSDNSDIISNNIMVSQSFNNAVTVYYSEEPVYDSSAANGAVYPFTIKAFGDTRDGDTRILETFQKNIDPNYFDIAVNLSGLVTDYNGTSKYNEANDDAKNQEYNSRHFDTSLKPVWNKLPAFYKVGLGLLQREVEQMYRGTLQLVGYPYIEPFDIIHLDDQMNNMVGTIEVEEVIHSFNPQQGFITTITPSMITYDRNPIRMAEIATMKRIVKIGEEYKGLYKSARRWNASFAALGAAIGVAGVIGTGGLILPIIMGLGAVGSAVPMVSNLYGATYGANVAQNNFLYDHFGNLFGRDCINFSALTYHGAPFMGGFGGVDYTNITSIINHQAMDGSIMRRMAGAADYESAWIASRGNLENMDLKTTFFTTRETPFISNVLKGFYAANVWGKKNRMRYTMSNMIEHNIRNGFNGGK